MPFQNQIHCIVYLPIANKYQLQNLIIFEKEFFVIVSKQRLVKI